ncbi:Protein CBG17069 [Caenorhabditis briggsae]|uniref:Protein CBG17069 n=1 Tax=Caenorhabditis briggsae TaxID=6238 RepID=A8XQG2_CAEBR|nr:Protein CBG17069 [Caenorhabditis briggsae]CAP34887.1 Protein CBG17069 [Caenorhabditis briggsae]
MECIVEDIPGPSSAYLPVRHDASKRQKTCRKTMNPSKLLRRKKQRKEARSSSVIPVHKDPSICNVCKKRDPELDPDMHEEGFDAQFTEWRRSKECLQPVHFLCTNLPCPSCGGNYEHYEPSEESKISESSESSASSGEKTGPELYN